MSVKPDRWIRKMALEHKMIEPFTDRQVREGVIATGFRLTATTFRVADEFQIFTKSIRHRRSKAFRCAFARRLQGRRLHRAAELLRARPLRRILPHPRNVLTICLGKSTYARCGIIVNVTPFEPEWEGFVTLEISNTTPLPQKFTANEGLCQVLFFLPTKTGEVSYKDKKGNTRRIRHRPPAPLTKPANQVHLRFLLELKDENCLIIACRYNQYQ